jgi:hypothetical protein
MKKFRGIRRHYRKIEKLIANHEFHFDDSLWYNHWHIHLDWKGITDESVKHRRSHIKNYLKILQRVLDQSIGSGVEFQCWICIDPGLGQCDAIYIQTKNPHSEFPIRIKDIEWDIEVPELLKGLINPEDYIIGRSMYENSYYYFFYKIGTGIPLK